MDDGTPKHDPNPRAQCDHICLGEYGHDSPHFYGYRSGTPVDEINRLIDEIERLHQLGDTLAYHVRAGEAKEMYSAVHAWDEARRG